MDPDIHMLHILSSATPDVQTNWGYHCAAEIHSGCCTSLLAAPSHNALGPACVHLAVHLLARLCLHASRQSCQPAVRHSAEDLVVLLLLLLKNQAWGLYPTDCLHVLHERPYTTYRMYRLTCSMQASMNTHSVVQAAIVSSQMTGVVAMSPKH